MSLSSRSFLTSSVARCFSEVLGKLSLFRSVIENRGTILPLLIAQLPIRSGPAARLVAAAYRRLE